MVINGNGLGWIQHNSMRMNEITDISTVVDLLKQNEVLFSLVPHKRYYRLLNDKVWLRDESLSIKLTLKDFIAQFKDQSFYLHSPQNEEYIDLEKDIEYYAWREKSQ